MPGNALFHVRLSQQPSRSKAHGAENPKIEVPRPVSGVDFFRGPPRAGQILMSEIIVIEVGCSRRLVSTRFLVLLDGDQGVFMSSFARPWGPPV